jgi:hypothetical protein
VRVRGEVWRKSLTGGYRVLQVLCLMTGVVGLVALSATPVESWFRNGVGAVVGVLMAVVLVWTVCFALGWAFLTVRHGEVRIGFTAVVWSRPSFPLSAVAEVAAVEVDPFDHGGHVVGGDPAGAGLLVTSGGREAVRFELWDGSTYLVTLRRSDEVAARLRELLREA